MWKIKETVVSLIQGDITDCSVDAIVNAANTKLILGAGVAGVIKKKGGPQIQEECSKHGPIELGQAAITTGGMLKAKYVIHAASMNLGSKTTDRSLKSSILKSLLIGKEYKLESIAFPAIGTGIAGFPLDKCAKIMVESINHFLLNKKHNYKQIQIVLFTENDFTNFKEIFSVFFSEYQ